MNNNSRIFRHEIKFQITEAEKMILLSKIKDVMKLDKHAKNGTYLIRSLYFDDLVNSAYQDKMAGISARRKYRIRLYDHNDSVIHLERKQKQDQYILKESASLTRKETEMILSGTYDFLLQREEAICKDFYIECMTNSLRPKVIVDYERIPYVFDEGDVRVTFDQQIRSGMLSFDLFDKNLPTLNVMESENLIMELKFTEFLPQIIRNLIPTQHLHAVATSKYVLCFDKKYGMSSK